MQAWLALYVYFIGQNPCVVVGHGFATTCVCVMCVHGMQHCVLVCMYVCVCVHFIDRLLKKKEAHLDLKSL